MPGKWATARRHRDIGSGNGQVAVGGIPTKLRHACACDHAPCPCSGNLSHARSRAQVFEVTIGYMWLFEWLRAWFMAPGTHPGVTA
jgi:hypothetical protein